MSKGITSNVLTDETERSGVDCAKRCNLEFLTANFPITNVYNFTYNMNKDNILALTSIPNAITMLKRYIGQFIEKQTIKKCFYVIEISKNGKVHAHGTIYAGRKLNYTSINESVRGHQIWIKPAETTANTEDRDWETFFYSLFFNKLSYISL